MRRLLVICRWVLGHLPAPLGRWVARRTGDLLFWLAPAVRQIAATNVRHAFAADAAPAEIHRAVRRILQNVCLNYFDALRAQDLSDSDLAQELCFDGPGWDSVTPYIEKGYGVILVSAHFGAIDIVSRVLRLQGLRSALIVDRLTNHPLLFDFVTDLRRKNGWELFFVEEGPETIRGVLQALRGGAVVCMLLDRNVNQTGVLATFLGRPMLVNTGIARIALHGKNCIVPCSCYYDGRQYQIKFDPPIDAATLPRQPERVEQLTQALAAHCSRFITQQPDQWLLLTPCWPDSL